MFTSASHTHSLAIRLATRSDEPALSRLAALDSRPAPAGPVLVAELGGSICAAISLREGTVVADPFQSTAEIVEILRLRVAQIRVEDDRPRLSLRVRPARAPRPAMAY